MSPRRWAARPPNICLGLFTLPLGNVGLGADTQAPGARAFLLFPAAFALVVPLLLVALFVVMFISVACDAGRWYLFVFIRFAEALGAQADAIRI